MHWNSELNFCIKCKFFFSCTFKQTLKLDKKYWKQSNLNFVFAMVSGWRFPISLYKPTKRQLKRDLILNSIEHDQQQSQQQQKIMCDTIRKKHFVIMLGTLFTIWLFVLIQFVFFFLQIFFISLDCNDENAFYRCKLELFKKNE